jgi:hypothetical protein
MGPEVFLRPPGSANAIRIGGERDAKAGLFHKQLRHVTDRTQLPGE